MGFREYMPTQLPPWLQGNVGKAWASALGGVKDGMTQLLKERVAARFPVRPGTTSLSAIAPTDALEALGREQQMPRAVGESDADYAERLSQAFEIWEHAGTAYGVLLALRGAGYTTARLAIVRGRLYHLDSDGKLVVERLPVGSWSFEPEPQPFWSKFALVFDHEAGLPEGWYGPPAPVIGAREVINVPAGSTGPAPTLSLTGTLAGAYSAVRVRASTATGQLLWSYSFNDGATWQPTQGPVFGSFGTRSMFDYTLGVASGLSLSGLTVAGPYLAGTEWRFPISMVAPVVVPPTDAVSVRGARQLALKWKSAISTFAGVVIISKGRSLGTMPKTLGEWAAPGTLSGHEVTFYGPTPA